MLLFETMLLIMVAASQLLEDWDDLPCFAHTLQLAVKAGLELPVINRLSAVCRKIVGHFKHSVLAMQALKEKQMNMNVARHSLLQDVSTRWNSTYFMYERLIEQRWTIYVVIHDDNVTASTQKHLDLRTEQWDLLSQLVTVLKSLQVATTALSEDQNISSSLIYPVVNGLLKCHLKEDKDDMETVKQFQRKVSGELLRRFDFIPDGVPAIAAALDPRHHHLNFFSEEERSQVHDIISSKLEQLHSDSESTQEPQAKKRKEDSKDSAMSFLLGTSCESTSTLKWRDEILQFRREPQMHHDSNLLNWWKVNESRFPTLAKMARCYLCVPATSVPSERVFSTAGLVINDRRSSLSPENVDMLIFLSKNLRMIKTVDVLD